MKILVTGLCLSRNLGGPAMGLTLIKKLKEKYPDTIFTFAVSPIHYHEEQKWASFYGVNTVRMDYLPIHLLNKYKILKLLRLFSKSLRKNTPTPTFWSEIHTEFISAFQNAEIIIDMSGVLYVGNKKIGFYEALKSYTNFYYARLVRKPFIRFTQSFGPFDAFFVKYFAKKEFSKLPFIPARGKISAEFCKSITNQSKIFDFPDIAILLQKEFYDKLYVDSISNCLPKHYIVISPSFVINNKVESKRTCTGRNYREMIVKLINYLVLQNLNIVFLPHTFSKDKRVCDREVCVQILKQIDNISRISHKNIFLIHDEINPMQAKFILSRATFAIVSRYHALVAALSSFVPAIGLGWHNKYKDILDYYNFADFSIDVTKTDSDSVYKEAIIKIDNILKTDYSVTLKSAHENNLISVNKSFDKLYKWIDQQL